MRPLINHYVKKPFICPLKNDNGKKKYFQDYNTNMCISLYENPLHEEIPQMWSY